VFFMQVATINYTSSATIPQDTTDPVKAAGIGYVNLDILPPAPRYGWTKGLFKDIGFAIKAVWGRSSHKTNYMARIAQRTNDKAAIVFLHGLKAHPSQFDGHHDAFKAKYGNSVALFQPFQPLKGNNTVTNVLNPAEPQNKTNWKRILLKVAAVALFNIGLGLLATGIGTAGGIGAFAGAFAIIGITTKAALTAGIITSVVAGIGCLAGAGFCFNAPVKDEKDENEAKIFQEIFAWAKNNPFKPIVLMGVSNGSRLAAHLAIMLREAGIENPIKVSCIAGVMFGTTMMNQPTWSPQNQQRWREALQSGLPMVGGHHPEIIKDLSWASDSAKQLIAKIRIAAEQGMDFEFFVSASDNKVTPPASAFPSKVWNASYYFALDEGHSSIIAASLATQLETCSRFIDRRQ
jgi:hypothetical protein